jgi:DNA-binding transcriptional regulator of glucitol operon
VIARRLAVFAVCVISLLGACLLAWWQWNRYESASGSWQNLGYVLQWPLFGLFPAFMFWRIRRLKAKERAGAGPAAPSVPAPRPVMTRPKPVQVASDEPDDELTAYNRYLAELNTKEQSG